MKNTLLLIHSTLIPTPHGTHNLILKTEQGSSASRPRSSRSSPSFREPERGTDNDTIIWLCLVGTHSISDPPRLLHRVTSLGFELRSVLRRPESPERVQARNSRTRSSWRPPKTFSSLMELDRFCAFRTKSPASPPRCRVIKFLGTFSPWTSRAAQACPCRSAPAIWVLF